MGEETMDRQQALEEVLFIKNLLEDTGREISKSGWAFIWLGLIMIGQGLLFIWGLPALFNLKMFNQQTPSWVDWIITYGSCIVIPILVLILCFRIYRKQTRITVALEKQIWQVWWWMILANYLILFGECIIGFAASLRQTGSGGNINYSILETLPLIITGVLTKRKFFYGSAIVTLILGFIPYYLFTQGMQQLPRLMFETFYEAFPFLITGFYFLAQPGKHKVV
jgi:hypothetical protein